MQKFYIDELRNTIDDDSVEIQYVNSQQILVNGELLSAYIDRNNLDSKKKIFKRAEERAYSYLSSFTCTKNPDVQDFLRTKCISFQKKNSTRTYLLISEKDKRILGYYRLALKSVFLEPKIFPSNIRRLTNIMKHEDCELVNAFLIGQIGRDDQYTSKDISLTDFLDIIISQIEDVRKVVGGASILVEVSDEPKLIKKYQEYGFELLQNDRTSLSQLWQFSLNY